MMPGSTSTYSQHNTKHSRDKTESSSTRRNLFTRTNSYNSNWRGAIDENANLKRSLDEQRQHISRLKNENDLEKEKTKQVYRDQVTEVKRVRDECGLENTLNLEANSRKMKRARDLEMKKLKETLAREKDLEIKQIIKFKDEEIRAMQKTILEEHETILKNTEDQFKRKVAMKGKTVGEDVDRKLRQEIVDMKKSKEEMEISYRAQVSITNEKKEQIFKIRADFEKELNKLNRENQKEHVKNMSEIKQLRKALQEQTTAAEKSNTYASRLIEEKQDLARRLKQDRIHLQEKSLNSTENRMSATPSFGVIADDKQHLFQQMEKDRGLQSKNVDLRRQLEEANKKVKLLEKEKESTVLHSTPVSNGLNSFNNSSVADKRSIKLLKRRNAELVAIAKKLEEKGLRTQKELDELKALKLNSSDMFEESDNVNSLRKSFAIKRAKDLAENARLLLQKDKQIEELRYTKKSVLKEEEGDLEKRILNNHDDGSEYLHLQTELSSALEKNQNISIELDHLRDTHSTCDEYMEELINKQNDLKNLTQKLTEKEDECTALSTSILKKDQEMNYLQKDIKDKEFQCCRLIEESDHQRSNIRDLEENILTYKEQLVTLKRLQDERDQLNALLLDANNYSNKLEEEIDDLQNQIDSIKNTVLDQQDKIKVLMNENTLAKERLIEREEQIAELHKVQEESRVSYTNSVSSLKDDLRNVEAKCNKLESHEKLLKIQLEQSENGKIRTSQTFNNIYTQTGCLEVKDFGVQFPTDNENVHLPGNDSYNLSRKRRNRSSRRRSMSPNENDCSEIDVTDFSLASNDIFDTAGKRIRELEASDSEGELNSENRLTLNQSSVTKRINGFLSDDELSIEEIDLEETGYDIINIKSQFYDVPVLFNRFRKLTQGCENLFRLYIAKYTYDPSLYSPNEDHDLELPLEAGMQIYVYGEMDEDGFFLAESKTGSRGLVPSNLVELVGDGLNLTRLDSSTADQMINAYGSDEDVTEVPPLDEEAMRHLSEIPIPDEYLQQSPKIKTSEVLGIAHESTEQKHDVVEVPPPRSLRLDRQLNNSTVMCWQPPDGIKQCKIKGYSIYVDGKKRQTILGSSRTKALVSDIDQKLAYRISVHTLTINGDESRDDLAVVTVGTGRNIHAPYDLKLKHVKSLSADLSWKPSNSSYYHAVYRNNENITTLQPGVCTYTLSKLIPDNTYTIKVESRKYISKSTSPDWSRFIEFRTALGVKPDAPLYVCSEITRDYLQVSWLPVTINEELGSSNGSIVTGYSIYVDEEQCATVKSPTSDTVNIPLWKFSNRFREPEKEFEVLVRTQSTAGESENSNISVVDVNSDAKSVSEKLSTSPQDGKPTSPCTNEHEGFRNASTPTLGDINKKWSNPFRFTESDLDRLQESVIDEPCSSPQDENGNCRTNEVSLDASDPDYKESLDPTWSEISDAFKETDSIETHFNPENEHNGNYTDDDRIIVSDGDLSIIEEVSEPESVLSARLHECSTESLYEISHSTCNKSEPLKHTKYEYNKLNKSEPIEIHKIGLTFKQTTTETSSSSEKLHIGKDSLDPSNSPSTHSSKKTYTVTDSPSDDNTKTAGHACTQKEDTPLEQNHDATFTLSSRNESRDGSSSNNTYTILPDVDPLSPKENSEQVSDKSNTASSYTPTSKSTPLNNSDSNSIMDDSLIESVQMSSMKLSGIIASQVSELSSQLSSIVFSCDSDDEATPLPVDEVAKDASRRTAANDTKRGVEDETHAIAVDDQIKTVELDTSKAVIELPRDSNHTMYASGELDTSRAVTDLTEDSSKCSKKETQRSEPVTSSESCGVQNNDDMDIEKAIIEIPNKVSVAQRICEFENQKEHLRIIKTKSKSLPCEDSLKNELPDNISSLSNGYHSSGESVFSDDVYSAPKVKPKPKPKRRTFSLTETRDMKEKYMTGCTPLKDNSSKLDISNNKIGFIDANRLSNSQNKLTISRSLHSNDTHRSEHVLSSGISDCSSDDEKVKSSSDEEIKLEIFNIPQEPLTNNTPPIEVNVMSESYLIKNKKNDGKKGCPSSKDTVSSKSSSLIESNHTEAETSSDEYVINEDLNFDHSETNDLYNPHINGDDRSAGSELLPIVENLGRNFVINKPIQNLYSFGGNIDISSSEQDVSEANDISETNNVADLNDDATASDVDNDEGNDDFNVTQINDMEESSVSRISTVPSDSERLSKSTENANEVLQQIEEKCEESMFQCSSPLDSQADMDANLLFECPLPEEYQKEYDEQSIPDDAQKCRIFVANFSYDPLTMSPNVELVDDELAFLTGDLIKVYGDIGIDGFYFGELNGKRGYLPGNMVTEVDSSTSELKKVEPLLSNGDSFFDLSTGNRKLGNTEPGVEEVDVERANLLNHAPSSSGNNSATRFRENTSGKRVLNSKSSSTNNLSRDSGEDLADVQTKSCSMPNVSSDYFDKLEFEIDNEDLYNAPDPYLLKPMCVISLFPYDPATSSPNVDAEVELSFQAGEIIEIYGEMDEDGFYAGKLNNAKGLVPSNFVRKATEKEILKGFSATSTNISVPKKKTSLFKKSKKIFSRLKGK